MLRSCTSGILAHILDPAVPFVWIRRHTPKRYIQWVDDDGSYVPLRPCHRRSRISGVRQVVFAAVNSFRLVMIKALIDSFVR